MLREVKSEAEAVTEQDFAFLLVEDDEAMLTLVLGPIDVALAIVINVDVLLLVCCDTVLTDEVVDTADITLGVDIPEDADVVATVDVPEDADVVATVDDDPGNVDVLTVVVGPPDALVTDTAVLDC